MQDLLYTKSTLYKIFILDLLYTRSAILDLVCAEAALDKINIKFTLF